MKHWKTVREFKQLLRSGNISPEQVCFTATSFDELEQTIATVQLSGKCRIAVVIFPEEKEMTNKEAQLRIEGLIERLGVAEDTLATLATRLTKKKPKPKLVVTKEAHEESE